MEKTSILKSKKNRIITDLVLFGVNFGVGFVLNLIITNEIHFMLYLVFIYVLFSLNSLGFGALYNAFEHSYVKKRLKYTVQFLGEPQVFLFLVLVFLVVRQCPLLAQ